MSKKTTVTEPEPQVTITYNRDLKLMSDRRARIKLRHLRELVREASEKGFDDDSPVSVYRGSYTSDYQMISVEAKN